MHLKASTHSLSNRYIHICFGTGKKKGGVRKGWAVRVGNGLVHIFYFKNSSCDLIHFYILKSQTSRLSKLRNPELKKQQGKFATKILLYISNLPHPTFVHNAKKAFLPLFFLKKTLKSTQR